MKKLTLLSLMAAGLFPSVSSAEIEIFLSEYTETVVQTGPDTVVPFGDYSFRQFGDTYRFSTGIVANNETITAPTITGPSAQGGVPLVLDDGDDAEYYFEEEFSSVSAMTSAIQPGTYIFSGTDSTTGAFSQTIEVPAYTPLSPLKVVNFTELQSIDPTQPVTIQWEPFTEAQGEGPNLGSAGVINVEVTGYNESGSVQVYASDDFTPEDGFGLTADVTSVTIPAENLSADMGYIVNIFFAHILSASEATSPAGALVVNVRGYEIEFNMTPEGMEPFGRSWGGYAADDMGWVDTGSWLSELNVTHSPWIWSPSLNGWIFTQPEDKRPNGGWVYVPRP